MIFLYSIFLFVYAGLLRVCAPFNSKAKKFVQGRRQQWQRMQYELQTKRKAAPLVHFHCASTGEFEQARPIIEEIKRRHSAVQVFLTFFSPSGYEACKNYSAADYIFYLPMDFAWNARRFACLVKPDISIFVKYEFWRNHIKYLHENGTKCYVVSAIFRRKQPFFQPIIGGFFRKILYSYEKIFVQDEFSLVLLKKYGIQNAAVAGDTRFDRVSTIVKNPKPLPLIEKWACGHEVLAAGSTWSEDEALLVRLANEDEQLRIIFVPHEIHEARILTLMRSLRKPSVLYSQLSEESAKHAYYIVVDCVGILSSVYGHARYAYIGGGFGSGIHNTLEAAAWGIPIFFGTNYKKFKEARDLLALRGAVCVKNLLSLQEQLKIHINHPEIRWHSVEACRKYVKQNTGAVQRICSTIFEQTGI